MQLGGTITGEHGVGIEKINSMCVSFRPRARGFLCREEGIRSGRAAQPRQGDSTLARCAEYGKMHVHGGALPHPEIPRF